MNRTVVAVLLVGTVAAVGIVLVAVRTGGNPTVFVSPVPDVEPSRPSTGRTASTAATDRSAGGDVAFLAFPEVVSRDLNGLTVTLPRDFPTALTVVLVAYERDDQRAIDSWIPALSALEAEEPSLRYVELPVVGEASLPERVALDFWMRRGIPGEDGRARTITLYTEREPFRRALDIEVDDQISVLLVDAEDRIVWRHVGPFDESAAAELGRVVRRIA
ncbi:MAG: hypothetical protein AAGA65_26740 [Actinomycetota bacterium]